MSAPPKAVPGLRRIFEAFAYAGEDLSREAFACFDRSVLDLRLRRLRFGALGLACDDEPKPSISRILSWPGVAAFPGAARVELPARFGLAAELPIVDAGVGAVVLALPVLEWFQDEVQVIDIVWCSPIAPARWARMTGLGMRLGPDPGGRLEPGAPVRVHRYPLTWFRALAAAQAGGDDHFNGICLLESDSDAAEALLLGPPLVCDDADHAAAITALQRRCRQRALRTLPRPGKVYVARSAPAMA